MSDGHRRQFNPLIGVGLVLIAMVGGVRLSQERWVSKPAIEAPRYIGSGEQPQPAIDQIPSALSLDDVACAKASRTDENDADQKDKWDLCAQLRSARATERAVMEAKTQTIVSLWGLGAIVLSLLFSGWAAREAARSARAATESNNQAREFFARDRRAWLAITGKFFRKKASVGALQEYAYFAIRVENVGRAPATNVFLRGIPFESPADNYEREIIPKINALASEMRANPGQKGITLYPGQHHVFERPIKWVRYDPDGLRHNYIVGLVQYRIDTDELAHISPYAWLATAVIMEGQKPWTHAGKLWEAIDPD